MSGDYRNRPPVDAPILVPGWHVVAGVVAGAIAVAIMVLAAIGIAVACGWLHR